MVWCPKCRKGILLGLIAKRLDALLREIADERGWNVVASEVMPDNVHIFVRVGPADSPAEVARVLGSAFLGLRVQSVLWSKSYFVTSVGEVCEQNVRRVIEHQWDRAA